MERKNEHRSPSLPEAQNSSNYFTNLRELGSLHLENPPAPVRPRFYYFTILLFYGKSGVCISKTHLCRLDPEFTALLISREIQRKFLPLFLLLIEFPPRAQQFASRKPTCASPTQILLFYYFTNFTGNREFASRKQVCISKTYLCMSDPKKVCISKTQPCMSDPQFACRTEGSRLGQGF